MIIEVGNTTARVTHATESERAWLDEYLSYTDKAAQFRARYTGKSPVVHLFSAQTSTFPAGYVPLVVKTAQHEGRAVDVVARTVPPVAIDNTADIGWLRDYQMSAIDAVKRHSRGILHLPTGGGKGELIAAIPLVLPCTWLMLVNSISLVMQGAERFERRTGLSAGRIGDGVFDIPKGARFIACSFDSLRSLLERGEASGRALVTQAQGLIVDEVHAVGGDTLFRTCQSVQAYYRIGLSATPLSRGDNKNALIIGAIGPVIYRVDVDTLVGKGVIERPHVHLVPFKHEKPVDVNARSTFAWSKVYANAIVKNASRNALALSLTKRAEKPCIVFVKNISHGKALTKALEREGIKARFVWGDLSATARDYLIKDVERGVIDVLVASVVFQVGVDIPSLRSAVIVTGGKSTIATIQRVGRGMRKAEGKTGFDVYDIEDVSCGCVKAAKAMGLRGSTGSHAACRWLEAHSHERVSAYVKEAYEVTRDPSI